MLLITIIGWLIRLELIHLNLLFHSIVESEFLLGYWGIRYLESTRNADYLYPLIGLAISLYFYLSNSNKIYLFLTIIFQLTLIASLSRGAIIIAILTLFFLFYIAEKRIKIYSLLVLIILFFINFDYIYNIYLTQYAIILESIFQTKSIQHNFSNESRIVILTDAIYSSLLNPIGYGLDNYQMIYSIFDFNTRVSNSAENAFITILVERGWVAFLALLLIFFATIKYAYNYQNLNLNKVLAPMLLIYFTLNYELNNMFSCFTLYILLLDNYLNSNEKGNFLNG